VLTDRDDYYWYGGNAIKRIAIEGKPYPERSAKLVMLGEDEAYIQEAARERVDEAHDAFRGFFEDYVLRIPQPGYPWSDWCWRLIQQLDTSATTSVRFLDPDKAEEFEVPSSPFLVWRATYGDSWDERYLDESETLYMEYEVLLEEQSHYWPGSPDWERLQVQIDAKRAQMQAVVDIVIAEINVEAARQDAISLSLHDTVSDALQNCNKYAAAYSKAVYGDTNTKGLARSLSEDLRKYADDRDASLQQADSTYSTAKAEIDQTRSSALAKAKKDYDNEVSEILDEYAKDPPEGVDEAEWARRKALALWDAEVGYSDKRDRINATWQTDSWKAGRDRDAAIVDARRTYISDAKERWLSHIEQVNELRETFEESVNEENAARNREVEGLLAQSTHSGNFGNYGIPYAYGLVAIDESRRDMAIDFSCLDHYLRKTPVPTHNYLNFVAHAHSSDATIRMYADLEMRRCVDTMLSLSVLLYRDAFDRTYPTGTTSFEEHVASGRTYTQIRYKNERVTTLEPYGGYEETDSSSCFSVYFGRRHEVEDDSVEAIYATVAVRRDEYTARDRGSFGWIGGRNTLGFNYTYGYLRVKLENMGVQNASYLAQLDRIDDDLADAIAAIDNEYAEARAEIEDEYLKALDAADRAFDEDVAEAAKERDKAILAAHDDFMDAASPMAAACNSELQAIDDDEDMENADKKQKKHARLDRFWRDIIGLYSMLSQAIYDAEREYEEAVADAKKKRDDAKDKAKQDRTDAIDRLDAEMQVEARKADLRANAREAKDEVYASAADAGVTLRPDARCKWSFDARVLDGDRLSLPEIGDRGPKDDFVSCLHISAVYVAGLVHLDVVYKPKSETGMDYAPYMAEAKSGYERPRKYRPLKFFDYSWTEPTS
jgi:hypothetical protein